MEASMLIGGEWRRAALAKLEVINPATEADRQRARRLGSGRRAWQWRRPSGRSPTGRPPTPKRARIMARAIDLIEENARVALAARTDRRAGQAVRRGPRRGDPPRPRRALLRRGGDQGARRLPGSARDVRPRLRPGDPAADRSLRRDHAVQLPAHAAGDQGRAGAGERQHGRRQAGRHDAAGHAAGGPAVRRGGRSPTVSSTSSPVAARRSAVRSSATRTCGGSRTRAPPRSAAASRSVAAPQLSLSLGLGGSDPVIVCEDADVEAAVKAVIIGRYWNAGQACHGCKRVFVDSVFDGFRAPAGGPRQALRGRATAPSRRAAAADGADPHPAGRDELLAQLQDGVGRAASCCAAAVTAVTTGVGSRAGRGRQSPAPTPG